MYTRAAFATALALVLLLVLLACSTLQPAADQAGRAIKRYCDSTPLAVRQETRRAVNAAAAPHRAEITCTGDPTS